MGRHRQSHVQRARSIEQGVRSPLIVRFLRSRTGIVWGIGLLLGAFVVLFGSRLWLSSNARIESAALVLPSIPSESRPGVRALAEEVLRALHRQDRAALERLLLTKEGFCNELWPALPPTPNLSCEWVWSAYAPQNAEGLYRILQEHGGRAYTLLRVEPQRIVAYGDVRVYERVRLVVMDETGRERAVRLFGSICEIRGTFRLCSFILD
ncbi:MAG: hypothetical protein N0A16_07690 [Blastocatellia bacterium]|nr:hypothetical protein [Blastocatellia bacterium]MCS7157595.1 hypothetical protein [Blastocatellia bacterium]MCX7751860.1 hypothetical protein [Blastocatellia bacterium]MDW8166966.1 hypothetical protein [Acidobacteriota bacterium]MDW8257070.1 hypothetical protein [Acidobacteriota bacterium]